MFLTDVFLLKEIFPEMVVAGMVVMVAMVAMVAMEVQAVTAEPAETVETVVMEVPVATVEPVVMVAMEVPVAMVEPEVPVVMAALAIALVAMVLEQLKILDQPATGIMEMVAMVWVLVRQQLLV